MSCYIYKVEAKTTAERRKAAEAARIASTDSGVEVYIKPDAFGNAVFTISGWYSADTETQKHVEVCISRALPQVGLSDAI